MDRRSFLKGLGVAAAGGWSFLVSACGRGKADLRPFDFGNGEMLVVDEDPDEVFFPGGITKQSDGSYFAVYQRQSRAGSAYVRGRTLLPVGPEEVFYDGRSIDPSVTTLASGETLINLHRRGAIWLIVREGEGTFTQPIEVGPAGESMISTVGTRTFVAYAEARSPDVFNIPVYSREIFSATEWGPQVDTGARVGSFGRELHEQKRSSIGGLGDGLLLAWNEPAKATGGYRSIWVARSRDGREWDGHTKVADTGQDLRNPFALQVSDQKTRVYYVQPGKQPLGMVRTTDGGESWSAPADVPVPPDVSGSARPSFFIEDGTIYCFTAYQGAGGGRLVIFPVP